jgi:hypothetical protein
VKRIFILVTILATSFLFSLNAANAHNFYKNDASIFFTLIKQFQGESELTRSNFPQNTSLALEHAENAAGFLRKIINFKEDNLDDKDFADTYNLISNNLNSTTNALIATNLGDEIMKQYGVAIGLNSSAASKLTNMSMSTSRSSDDNQSGMAMSKSMVNTSNTSSNKIVNPGNYQTAIMLADSLKATYSNDLRNAKLPNSTGLMSLPMQLRLSSVNDLGNGIDNLISALKRKAVLDEVTSIVHGQIHPNAFMAFDLRLKSD